MTKEQNAGAAELSAFAPTEVMKEGYAVSANQSARQPGLTAHKVRLTHGGPDPLKAFPEITVVGKIA